MKKFLSDKRVRAVLLCAVVLLVLAGCQRNVDSDGNTLPERIIYLTTPWKDMLDESIFTAILVYPLAQCINWLGTSLHSGVAGVVITTLLYNLLTLGLSIKSSVNTQKVQMLQPELSKIQQKYEGRTDDAARMQQAQEMQALYNKHGINPMGSMLMPLLQFPILIAMYYASQRADVVVNGTIFGVALKTKPLDAFKSLGTLWPIALVFVIMAVLQAMSMLLPQHLAEQRKKKDRSYKAYDDKGASDQQKSQKYMMYGMLLLVIVLGLRWPAAMSVYWSVSSLANILKTLYIQKRYIDNDAKL